MAYLNFSRLHAASGLKLKFLNTLLPIFSVPFLLFSTKPLPMHFSISTNEICMDNLGKFELSDNE